MADQTQNQLHVKKGSIALTSKSKPGSVSFFLVGDKHGDSDKKKLRVIYFFDNYEHESTGRTNYERTVIAPCGCGVTVRSVEHKTFPFGKNSDKVSAENTTHGRWCRPLEKKTLESGVVVFYHENLHVEEALSALGMDAKMAKALE